LIFALSLPLGVIGCEEVAELELDEILPPEEVRERLVRQAPPGMEILSLRRIDFKAGAQIRSLTYRIALPAERLEETVRRAAEFMVASESWVERNHPTPRRVNLRPWLLDLQATTHLEMKLCLTPAGTARPEEVLTVLGLSDLLEAGAVLERARLELVDETPPQLAEGFA
jgi:radical SAM-linked protein